MVVFTDTVSHKMVGMVNQKSRKSNIPVERIHNASVSALENILENTAVKLDWTNLIKRRLYVAKERRAFEYKLIFHAAPTLLGIKCEGLFSLPTEQPAISENYNFFNCQAASKGLKTLTLRNDKLRSLIQVYNR